MAVTAKSIVSLLCFIPSRSAAFHQDAVDVGYRYFDCAEFYGNEAIVGEALAATGIPREELYLVRLSFLRHEVSLSFSLFPPFFSLLLCLCVCFSLLVHLSLRVSARDYKIQADSRHTYQK